MRDDTVPSLLIILPSRIEAPLTPPAFNVEQHIGQWTCEINSLRTPPPLGVLPALRLDNIEVRGGQGDATLIIYHSMFTCEISPVTSSVLNVDVLHRS